MVDVFLPPRTCHICQRGLEPHPIYGESGAQYCPQDGDFFIQRHNGHEPQVIFRPYDQAPEIKPGREEAPIVIREKSPAEKIDQRPPFASRIEWVLEPAEYLEKVKVVATIRGKKGRPGIVVRCDQTGEVFPSIREVSTKLGLDLHTIFKFFKGERRTVGGYTFTKLDDPYEGMPERRPPVLRKRSTHRAFTIKCDQTERIFPSMRIAAQEMHLNRDSIRKQVSGVYKDVHGYTFTKLETD
jgi:hypothetical protein